MIFNKTKGTRLSDTYILCTSALSKARGMMFRRKPIALVFSFNCEKRRCLHMMFVFFPIDVLFLDREKRIVEIKRKFMPFTFYEPKEKSKYIVELGEGKTADSEVGDIIDF